MDVVLIEVITEENVIFTMDKNFARMKKMDFSMSFFVRLLSNNPFKNLSFRLKLVIRLLIWNSAVCPIQMIHLYYLINLGHLIETCFSSHPLNLAGFPLT